jgi:glycopeptide antibiotics resistance protein
MVLDFRGYVFSCVYIILLLLTFFWYKINKSIKCRFWCFAVLIFYVLKVVKLAFFPIYINFNDRLVELARIRRESTIYLQLIPFRTISEMLGKPFWFTQIIGNIVFLFPVPVFLGLICFNKKISCINMICLGVFISLFIEVTQYCINEITNFPNCVTDIDDLILNSIGVLLGTFFLRMLKNEYVQYYMVKKIIAKN